jgi:hypothetical protein
MRSLLHIITRPEEGFVNEIIRHQADQTDNQVVVVDLTVEHPDYEELLEKIFTSDSIQVW